MRAGDTVYHRPSKETWRVAYVRGDYLAWYGWPPGEARVSDCDLVKACTDEEHRQSLENWASKKSPNDPGDYRQMICREQLFLLVKGFVGAGI